MPIRRVTLAVHDLVCASVFDRLRAESPSRIIQVEFDGEKPVEAAAAENVLYVPALHLQVWRDRIVPHEANAGDDAFPELQASSRAGEIMAHALFTNIQRCDEDVCVLSNLHSHNFYHFIEELYKVVILESAGFTGHYVFSSFPSRISQALPKFSIEFLALLGIAGDRIMHLGRPTLLRSAWFTTHLSHADTLVHRDVFFALRDRLRAAVDGPGLGPRLWLERRTSRPLVNSEEVHDCLRRYGFTIIDMADLPVSRQIAAAKNAQVLGGPHGAAFVNSMFMKERATVIECFSPLHVNPINYQICLNLKHLYFQMVQTNTRLDPYPYDHEVQVNCDHLELILRSLGQ